MNRLFYSFLLLGVLSGQVNDKNFKDKINDGVVIVVFTSKWAENDGMTYVKGVKGHEGAIVVQAKSEDLKKVCKKVANRFEKVASEKLDYATKKIIGNFKKSGNDLRW